MKKRLYSSLLLALLASACSHVEYSAPAKPESPSWQQAEAQSSATIATHKQWWEQFGSGELNSLLEKALQENRDMTAALARIEQLRASVAINTAPLYPQADFSGSAGVSKAESRARDNSFSLGLGLSYELDIFGRNRASRLASLSRLEAGEWDREALELIVISDVANSYFAALTFNERIAIAEQNLTRARDVYRIIEARHEAGRVSGLELSQQKVEVASNEAALSALRNQLVAARTALAVYTNNLPSTFTTTAQGLEGIVLPDVVVALPAQVVENRPDVKADEARLRAFDANIAAAKAEFFPRITLSASGSQQFDPTQLVGSLLAGLTQPIFQGGRLTGQLDLAEAQKKEAAEFYAQTLLTTFKEVEDALSGLHTAKERLDLFAEAADAAEKAYTIAKEQFEAGSTDFQALLDTQRSLLSAQDAYQQAKLELLQAHIFLFAAQGGAYQL